MQERRGILTAGSWVMDNNKSLARWPVEDTMNIIMELDRQGGGSGCNMAMDIKRLDPAFPVETIGLVGDDDDGRFLRAECEKMGIPSAGLQVVKGQSTPFSDCFNALESGKRTHLYYPGLADTLCPDHFDFSGTRMRLLHLGLPGAHKRMDAPWGGDSTGWATVLKAARAAGLTTNLEMVSTTREKVQTFGRSCLPHLDLLVVNDYEIGAVADIETRDGARTLYPKVADALRTALASGSPALAVAHFPEGAIAATRDGAIISVGSVAMPADRIAGVNGAGDAFAAGLLYFWHEGRPIDEAMRLGHACAAASMREMSTSAGVVPVAECLALADQWGFRPAPPIDQRGT